MDTLMPPATFPSVKEFTVAPLVMLISKTLWINTPVLGSCVESRYIMFVLGSITGVPVTPSVAVKLLKLGPPAAAMGDPACPGSFSRAARTWLCHRRRRY